MKVKIIAALFFIAGCLSLTFAANGLAQSPEKVSRPLEYSGYSFAEYDGVEKRSEYVEMSDGVKLAVDIYIPTGGPETSFPVILEYTPYHRAYIDLKNGPIHKSGRKALLNSDSPVIDMLAVPEGMGGALRKVLEHGYVFVLADMRGTGASSGWKADFMPKLGEDGGELINWIAKQSWCDGNVGMVGGSYLGYSQIVTAGCAGPALKAIAPTVVPLDGYNGEVYPGGVYLQGFMEAYSKRLGRLNLNYYNLNFGKILLGDRNMMLPAAPVVDEDGDGDYIDEIPLDLNRNGSFLDDYNYPVDPSDPPRYPDGNPREHIYYMASLDHRYNPDYHRWAERLMYIDGNLPAPFEKDNAYTFGPAMRVPALMKKDIAVYNIGGWFDTFTRGTTEYYSTMKDTNPSRMLIHPGFHSGGGPYWEYLGEVEKGDKQSFLTLILPELLRYFDFYLKGIDNGFDKEQPILIYVMHGGGWRQESEWPLARQVVTDYYFSGGNGLSVERSGDGRDDYKADFTHDSRYGKKKGNRYLGAMGKAPDVLPVRTQKDKQCLTYTTAPMAKDTEVTGHPIVQFYVSSSADYGDFFVYLEDVDENGEVVLVTEGVLRAGFARMVDNDEMIMGGGSGVDVKPELPWHGYERSDYVDAIFKNGNIVELKFDLKPTSWVFQRGHSIRVAIACADWPTFRLHPRLSTDNDPKNPANVVPTITVHRDAEHRSHIKLPVIPE